jgi:hypothetical protein
VSTKGKNTTPKVSSHLKKDGRQRSAYIEITSLVLRVHGTRRVSDTGDVGAQAVQGGSDKIGAEVERRNRRCDRVQ